MKTLKNTLAITVLFFLTASVIPIQSNALTLMHNHSNSEAEFKVLGNCGMCTTRIENAAKSVKGVSTATYSLEDQKLTVEFRSDRTSVEDIEKAVAEVGHDTENIKADDKTYKNLHQCCKYPREK